MSLDREAAEYATKTTRSAGRLSRGSARHTARIRRQYAMRPCALGSRISRAETAPTATTIVIWAL